MIDCGVMTEYFTKEFGAARKKAWDAKLNILSRDPTHPLHRLWYDPAGPALPAEWPLPPEPEPEPPRGKKHLRSGLSKLKKVTQGIALVGAAPPEEAPTEDFAANAIAQGAHSTLRFGVQVAGKTDLSGTWILSSTEGADEFLAATGMSWLKRQAVAAAMTAAFAASDSTIDSRTPCGRHGSQAQFSTCRYAALFRYALSIESGSGRLRIGRLPCSLASASLSLIVNAYICRVAHRPGLSERYTLWGIAGYR